MHGPPGGHGKTPPRPGPAGERALTRHAPSQPRSPDNRAGPRGAATKAAALARIEANLPEIHRRITHYKQAPAENARRLRELGLTGAQVAAIHRDNFPGQAAKAHVVKMTAAPGFKAPGDFISRFVDDFLNAGINAPAGTYQVGHAAYHDVGDTLHGKPTLKRTAGIGKQLGEQVAADFRHPLRHPGNVALDLGAAFGAGEGAVARGTAAAGALRAGESVGRAVTRKSYEGGSLLHRPNTGRVAHEVHGDEGKLTVNTPASKRAAVAAIQRKRAAKQSAGGNAEKAAAKALTKEQRITEAKQRAPMEALAHRSKKLSTPQQTALRVYNEGKTVAERVKFHEGKRDTAGAASAGRRLHQQKILLLKASAPYLAKDGVTLKPIAEAASAKERRTLVRLHDTQASLERVAKTRVASLQAIGKLEDGRIEARLHGPGRVIETGFATQTHAQKFIDETDRKYEKLVRTMAAAEVKPAGVVVKRNARSAKLVRRGRGPLPTLTQEARLHAERKLTKLMQTSEHPSVVRMRDQLDRADKLREQLNGDTFLSEGTPEFAGGRNRIPYTNQEAPRAHGRAQSWRGGKPRELPSVSHEFKGGLLHKGDFRNDTARLVAESGVEAQRHTSVLRLRDRVVKATRKAPREGDIAIRLDNLKNKPFPSNVQAVLRKREEGVKLTRGEAQLMRDELEKLREDVFPQIDPLEHAQHPDVKWISPDLLDGAQGQALRLSNGIGARPVEAIDAINNASKLAILYLKPAYAVPNIAGNAFLNVVQQGILAPANWARSGFTYSKLGPEPAATLDSVMGEGIAHSLSTGQGIGSKLVGGAAGKWSTAVDLIFRRAAFIHEARRLGYKGPKDLVKLLTDDTHHDDLLEVTQRAKDAIIDYENLSPAEREVWRRAIFFYPWVKGSTMYAGHFLTEHPIQAAATGNLGEYGKKHTGLGPTPSYLEGSFKAGGKLVNPAAAAVFQTPAQAALALRALAEGKVTEAARLGSFATPALDLYNAEVGRVDSFGNAISPRASGPDIAKKTLVDSLPQAVLAQRLQRAGGKGEANKLFPIKTKSDAAMPFLVGGVYPRRYNPGQLEKQATTEQRSLMTQQERTFSDFKRLHTDLQQAFRKTGEKDIPKDVAGRLALRHERVLNRVKASGGHKLTSAEAFGADVEVLARHKWMDAQEAKQATTWAQKASPTEVAHALAYLTRHYFDEGALLSASFKYLREHGSPNLKVPALP